ncbi:hypothetical protein OD91_0125 [Lutibacter sp. Hel_I_33_5]|uniref:hypothetical protein n=1 Tax=Lutibacter sp. Hel_I_33_5 TaxID=1566289 RepID=UPI00119F68B2|nr:hypothetical protein [Lutibacter sp. Hel_I_33_5]TVZ54888.1 hypothetical protein OD91_0125 [Lutibacter sp. Hel_I_33_5]
MENQYEQLLLGSIDLNETFHYQFMYASQNYGTFYAIYGKISEDKASLSLELVNYKGPINLGFATKNSLEDKNKSKVDGDILKIAIEVQGLSTNKSTTLKLNNVTDISNSDTIFIERFLHPLNKVSSPFSSMVFDSEFYYRSGENIIPNNRNKSVKELIGKFINTPLTTDKKNKLAATGGNCKTSLLNIIK